MGPKSSPRRSRSLGPDIAVLVPSVDSVTIVKPDRGVKAKPPHRTGDASGSTRFHEHVSYKNIAQASERQSRIPRHERAGRPADSFSIALRRDSMRGKNQRADRNSSKRGRRFASTESNPAGATARRRPRSQNRLRIVKERPERLGVRVIKHCGL